MQSLRIPDAPVNAALIGAPVWAQIASDALTRAAKWQWADSAYCKRSYSQAARGLPYCLHKTDRPEVRCVVNRRYRHVGAARDVTWSDYEALTGWHVPRSHFETLRDLGIVDERGYFFDDGCPPWRSREFFQQYRAKVEALLAPFVAGIA